MAVTFRKRNILLLLMTLVFVSIIFLWGNKATHKNKSLPSALKSAPVINPPGPVLQQPEVEGNNNSDIHIRHIYTLDEMRSRASTLNYVQKTNNEEKFGNHRADDPVIVIQSHDRHDLLKILLDSLRVVKGIESATLVISRDKFTPHMDSTIEENIEFCRYIQIFFPFSMQLFPDKYPGEDPNDCPRDLSKNEARNRKCNNAEYPDMYGHYREVKFVQLKHHWFWKFNMIFEGIRQVKGNTGPILFLEDDNYVLPDLIDVMKKSISLRDSDCPDCMSITLGGYESKQNYNINGALADVKSWISAQHNMGMMLNQKFFNQLSDCVKYFCTYDDYNWDWSLQVTALNCFSTPLHTLILQAPRVYHLGCTGFHQKRGGKCDIDASVQKLRTMIESEHSFLFPPSLKLESAVRTSNAPHQPNGGWGDIRDHELCQSYNALCKSFSNIDEK